MKKLASLLSFPFLLLLAAQVCFAAPVISSDQNASFTKNSGIGVLPDFSIQDDKVTPVIKAQNGIKITIPEGLVAVFDEQRIIDEISSYGTAVTNGKINKKPVVSFSDKDKTMLIKVNSDFAAGDSVTFSRISLRIFSTPTNEGQHLSFIYSPDAAAIQCNGEINIFDSTNVDTFIPNTPTNFKIEQTTNSSVKLTWTDPTDLDLQFVDVLRGINIYPVNGIAYKSIYHGQQSFVDTGLQVGDTVKYALRANDGNNASNLTNTITYTLVDLSKIVPVTTPPATTDTKTDLPVDTTKDVVTTPTETTTEPVKLSDIENSWAKAEIQAMADKGIVKGNEDGTFKPDENLNRADSAMLICRVMKVDEKKTVEADAFPDVKKESYYGSCVAQLKAENVVNGKADGTFKPVDSINRAEFIALSLRAYGTTLQDQEKINFDASLNASIPKTSFKDVMAKDWYANVAATAKDNEFVGGRTCGVDKCFDGIKSITRAEATAVLFRIFNDRLR